MEKFNSKEYISSRRNLLETVDCIFVGFNNDNTMVLEVVIYDEKEHYRIMENLSSEYSWKCFSA